MASPRDAGVIGPVKDEVLQNLSRQIGRDWRDIGRRLGMRDEELEGLHEDYRGHQREITYQMLIAWRKKRHKDATYKLLAGALIGANRTDLADYVEREAVKLSRLLKHSSGVDSKNGRRYREIQSYLSIKGSHSLVLGHNGPTDKLLHRDEVYKEGNISSFFHRWTHVFQYHRRHNEMITGVLVRDNRQDDLGGHAYLKEGGPGKDRVKVEVVSERGHGIDFTFKVFGKTK